ncbi:hypothetical protein BY996DRAFT_6424829 [Phakopsora pachyrhizi]|nr:hypothetical protein BY996DRAFT_6424829 [Phakopsora pachyrhizi]
MASLFTPRHLTISAAATSVDSVLKKGDSSVTTCAIDKDFSEVKGLRRVYHPGLRPDGSEHPTWDWAALGLSNENLHVNHIAVGFAPGFMDSRVPNTSIMINQHLPKPMALVNTFF